MKNKNIETIYGMVLDIIKDETREVSCDQFFHREYETTPGEIRMVGINPPPHEGLSDPDYSYGGGVNIIIPYIANLPIREYSYLKITYWPNDNQQLEMFKPEDLHCAIIELSKKQIIGVQYAGGKTGMFDGTWRPHENPFLVYRRQQARVASA